MQSMLVYTINRIWIAAVAHFEISKFTLCSMVKYSFCLSQLSIIGVIPLILLMVPSDAQTSNPKFLIQEDCNQDIECVEGILAYCEWRYISTKGSLWDKGPCEKKKQTHYIFRFAAGKKITVSSISTSKCKELSRAIDSSYSYEVVVKEFNQHFIRIYGIDRSMGSEQREGGSKVKVSEYEDFQFLYNSKEFSLVLRNNSQQYNQESKISYFKPYIADQK